MHASFKRAFNIFAVSLHPFLAYIVQCGALSFHFDDMCQQTKLSTAGAKVAGLRVMRDVCEDMRTLILIRGAFIEY